MEQPGQDEDAHRLHDSRTPPSAEAQARTRDFLGPKPGRAVIRLRRHTTYGLGGVEIELRGDGRTRIVKEAFGPHEQAGKHSARLDAAAAEAVLQAFVEQAFTEMFVGPQVGVPDELYYELTLTGASGQSHRLGKFVRAEHARFDALVRLVWEAVAAALDPTDRKRFTI